MIRSFLNFISYTAIFGLLMFIMLTSYWLFLDDRPPLIIEHKGISKSVLKASDVLEVYYATDYTRKGCDTQTIRYLRPIDGRNDIVIEVLEANSNKERDDKFGTTQAFVARTVIPFNISPGIYNYYSVIKYKCNPAQKWLNVYNTLMCV